MKNEIFKTGVGWVFGRWKVKKKSHSALTL